jgi:trimeric autotransporter adhesin
MKTKILSGLICCLGIFSANAQTITAPTGQSLTITNPIDVTVAGGTMNVPSDGSFNIGGKTILSIKGTGNLFLGEFGGFSNTSGYNNAFLGANTGKSNTTGQSNLFIGSLAGFTNTSGSNNAFMGGNSGQENITGSNNIFLGSSSGRFNTTGDGNSFIGVLSGYKNTTGMGNLFIGQYAGYENLTGANNTFIGNFSGSPASVNLTNSTAIGASASATESNTVVLGNAATTITGKGLAAGTSGLRFANLNSGSSTTAVGGSKVLSVDGSGNVVLVALTSGTINSVGGPTGPVVEKTWKEEGGYLYNNSTNGVVINGTGLDGNSLIVKGGVLSKEVNVKVEGAESWPDYVFKPSYKRMSLDEVEKFININGHLPNVASAAEMANTGNNLNKTDIKLLEKVEELTLYLLEMKKTNEAQNAEIQNLKKQVKSLRRK